MTKFRRVIFSSGFTSSPLHLLERIPKAKRSDFNLSVDGD
ncbi:hypothetical protein LINPERPRIM_LOCUS14641 [Linum perenne]